MPRTSKAVAPRDVGLKYGFRSGLEESQAAYLGRLCVPFQFEETVIEYRQPEKLRKYTPDFFIPKKEGMGGIFIETKGRFVTEDRQKHLHIRTCNPDLDIRFVFSNANARISKQSSTTYAMWAERHNFMWAHRSIPIDWLRRIGYRIPEPE